MPSNTDSDVRAQHTELNEEIQECDDCTWVHTPVTEVELCSEHKQACKNLPALSVEDLKLDTFDEEDHV